VGVGVHSGQKVELTLRPAPPDHGIVASAARRSTCRIVFRRTDPVEIPVSPEAVSDTRMATTISRLGRPAGPQGADHRAPAVGLRRAGAGQPVRRHHRRGGAHPRRLSAASFVFLLQSAGIELQNAPKRFLRVKKAVEVREGEGPSLKWARLEPYHGYKLAFEIEFHHPALDATGQRVEFDFGSGQYKRDIARARTFGFTKDVEMMRARGLGLGGSMDNVIVIDDYRVLNADGPALRRRVRQAQDPRRHRRHAGRWASRCWPATPPSRAATR
jgi:UDP-3-O-[3-hydroxymyristoyl] N-acetylglucosamine deacetylase